MTQAPTTPTPPVIAGTPQAPARQGANASAIYEGFKHQRDELSEQLYRLQRQRSSISEQLQNSELNAADEKGLEQRLVTVDQRISAVEKQIAAADEHVATAAAVPGAVVPPRPIPRSGPPEEAWFLGGMFIVVVLLPLSIAFARRIWKRSATVISSLPQELYERFARMEHSIDAIAVEVERIGESQRYLTRLNTEQRGLSAGAAEPVAVKQREREAQR